MIDYEILQDIITDHELCKVQENELAKIVELLKSDRLIELPCKAGDDVYKIHSNSWKRFITGDDKSLEIVKTVFSYRHIPQFGNLVFLTKEEAQKRLEELKNEQER